MTQRIVAGVGLGISLISLSFAALALVSVRETTSAAGQEQVTVAETVAMEVASSLDRAGFDKSAGTQAPRLSMQGILPRTPADLHVQLLSVSGEVLAEDKSTSAEVAGQHIALLRQLMVSGQPGYRVHQPGPKNSFSPHIVAYAPVPGHPPLGVAVQQGQTAVLDAARLTLTRFLVLGLVALAFAVTVAWIDVHRVIRPVRSLARAAESFATGRLSEPISIDRSDELGSLARSFETMRLQLRHSLDEIERWNRELEKRVEVRTRELRRRNRQLAAINAVAQPLSDPLDASTMLARALQTIKEVSGFEVALCREATGGRALTTVSQIDAPEQVLAEDVERGDCLCGSAVQWGRLQYSMRMAKEKEAKACRMAGLRSAVAIPLVSTARVEGVLFLGSRDEVDLQSGDLDTLAAIGQQVGMALANSRLYQNLREREHERAQLLQRIMDGQEEERRRLAQELHDDTSQALAWLQLGLAQLASGDPQADRSKEMAGQMHDVATQTLEAVHRLALELRPSVLDDIGLVAALERYVQESAERWHLTVDFEAVGLDHFRLMPAAETAVYRILQSAISNVVGHAQAKHLSLLLERRDDKFVAVVEDDGLGFDFNRIRAGSLESRYGLAGMEERASLIGAALTFETAPGAGTAVFLEVPLARNARTQVDDG